MPIIQVDLTAVPKEKKAELAKRLTQTAVEVLNVPQEAFTVIMRENGADNIAVGGTLLSERLKK